MFNEVSLAQLNHLAELRHALPGRMEEWSTKRVDNKVYTFSLGLTHYARLEGCVSRVEYPTSGDAKCFDKILDLFLTSNSAVDLFKVVSNNPLIQPVTNV